MMRIAGLGLVAALAVNGTALAAESAAVYSASTPAAKVLGGGEHVVASIPADGALMGPFQVTGAEPGDLLVVTLHRLTPTAPRGTSAVALAGGVVEDAKAIASNTDKSLIPWTVDTSRGVVSLALKDVSAATPWHERFKAVTIELPAQLSVGSIGVAPGSEGAVSADVAGPFGGRVDVPGLGAGARVMLPVFTPGAWLSLGDGFARQGDAGIARGGVRVPLDVEFSVEVVKKKEWPHSSVARPLTVVGEFTQGWPRVETANQVMTIGSGPTLTEAFQRATVEMHHWLDDDFGFSEKLVSIFMGQAVEYRIGRVDAGVSTVVAVVRKASLPVPLP